MDVIRKFCIFVIGFFLQDAYKVLAQTTGSSLLLFVYPRTQISDFLRIVTDNGVFLRNQGGVIEVNTYRVNNHEGMTWGSTKALAVLSFPDRSSATTWVNGEKGLMRLGNWTNPNQSEMEVLLLDTLINRSNPLSQGYKAHIFGALSGTNSAFITEAENLVGPMYIKYGGRPDVRVIKQAKWQTLGGQGWPRTKNDTIFFGPMREMNNITALFASAEYKAMAVLLKTGQVMADFYSVESFYSLASTSTVIVYNIALMFLPLVCFLS
ncbi:hypothetical protein ACJMK2_040218 [Sinanodonta woodiana]|uniref:Uncharacterized protein n=1 Tax=Sinanodonta woodiana TaxID=1069815 RepID=A0ABD3WED2_SINWO